jgi:rsbT co-antagonist protein RsbR
MVEEFPGSMSTPPPRDPRIEKIHERLSRMAAALGAPVPLSKDRDEVDQSLEYIEALEAELLRMRADASHAARRLADMSSVITAIVAFDYSKRVPFTERDDIFDGFAVYLNTLVDDLAASTVSKDYVSNIIESMSDLLLVFDEHGHIKMVNEAAVSLCGYTKSELVGRPIDLLFSDVDIAAIVRSAAVIQQETWCRTKAGSTFLVSFSASVMRNRRRALDGVVCVARDLTVARRAEADRLRMQEAIQRHAILAEELSTPLIPISDDIIVMPLIGSLDQSRATRMCEALLDGVVGQRARIVIIDVTGVRAVDAQAVEGIVNAAQALRMVGAEVVLTGIRPDIAVTLVGLGVDLRGIATSGSLQSAVIAAMSRLRAGKPDKASAYRR